MNRTKTTHTMLAAAASVTLFVGSADAVTYYWDNQAGAGFGAAGGTWGAPTTNQWSTSNSGADANLQASITTTNADSLNFGTETVGLGAGSITVSGTVAADTLTFGAASGNITLSGGVIDATAGNNLGITVNSAQATISSNIIGTPGANTRGINKAGSGMLTLSGDNSAYVSGSYSRTFISGGVLSIDNALSLPPGLITLQGGVLGLTTATGDFSRTVAYAPNAGTSVQFGTTAGGGFAAYGGDRSVTLNSGGTIQFGVNNNGILGPLMLGHFTADSKVTLTSGLDLNGGSLGGITRQIQAGDGAAPIDGKIGGVISDTGTTQATLQKTGAGTLELTNANTYGGATIITQGTLLINGDSSLATGPVSVQADVPNSIIGALGGTGTIGGSLTFATDSKLYVANLNDSLAVNGTVTFGTAFGVDDLLGIDWSSVAPNTYTLITGTISNFGSLDNNSFASAYDVGYSKKAYFQSGSLQLVVTAVPEPASLGLLGLGGLLIGRCRRA